MNKTTMISIERIGAAISVLCARNPSTNDVPTLCKPARVLADVYGLMIFERRREVALSALTPEQAKAFESVFTA